MLCTALRARGVRAIALAAFHLYCQASEGVEAGNLGVAPSMTLEPQSPARNVSVCSRRELHSRR